MKYDKEINRRKTFAIISHPDAGKTTMTEKLLWFGRVVRDMGMVKSKQGNYAKSDWMEMEKERGISVTSSVMQFPYDNHVINLLDTPGHEDFSEDTYRTLTAVDSALMVIDVNNGNIKGGKDTSQADLTLKVNRDAVSETTRQLRLRDIGGIIVIDFIDMKLPENRRKVQESLEDFMKTDRARHSVLPISKFGLLQATRQRIRPEVNINTSEDCPACNGTGKITSTLLLEDEIEKKMSYLTTHGHKSLILLVHPIIHSHLTNSQ